MMYVIRTDLRCGVCGITHTYVTRNCQLVVYTCPTTAGLMAGMVSGRVELIQNVPDGVPYHLFIQKEGRPDPTYAVSA